MSSNVIHVSYVWKPRRDRNAICVPNISLSLTTVQKSLDMYARDPEDACRIVLHNTVWCWYGGIHS